MSCFAKLNAKIIALRLKYLMHLKNEVIPAKMNKQLIWSFRQLFIQHYKLENGRVAHVNRRGNEAASEGSS